MLTLAVPCSWGCHQNMITLQTQKCNSEDGLGVPTCHSLKNARERCEGIVSVPTAALPYLEHEEWVIFLSSNLSVQKQYSDTLKVSTQ